MSIDYETELETIRSALAKIPEEIVQNFRRKSTIHVYSARLDAHHAEHDFIFRSPARCRKTHLLVFSGHNTTGASGRATISLASSLCDVETEGMKEGILKMVREPNFAATPWGTTPSLVTVSIRSRVHPLESDAYLKDRQGATDQEEFLADVFFDVMTWQCNGSPAWGVEFSWICTVEALELIRPGDYRP